MQQPGGKKFCVLLLTFLISIFFFWGTPGLSALHHFSTSLDNPTGLYAHSHNKPPFQPSVRTIDSHSKEAIRLAITSARLLCSEDECSHHHQDCDLEIAYRLSADIHSRLDVGARVVCQARLDYTTSHGYHLQSRRCSPPEAHTLRKSDYIDSIVTMTFQFSPYEQVVEAQVGAITCSIENVDILPLESAYDVQIKP